MSERLQACVGLDGRPLRRLLAASRRALQRIGGRSHRDARRDAVIVEAADHWQHDAHAQHARAAQDRHAQRARLREALVHIAQHRRPEEADAERKHGGRREQHRTGRAAHEEQARRAEHCAAQQHAHRLEPMHECARELAADGHQASDPHQHEDAGNACVLKDARDPLRRA